MSLIYIFIFTYFFKDFIYLFLERGEGRGTERERNIDMREKYRPVASHMCPRPGTEPETQACAMTGNLPGSLLLCNQMSHTSQGQHDEV